eukprot:186253-Amphidinium_carterae.1
MPFCDTLCHHSMVTDLQTHGDVNLELTSPTVCVGVAREVVVALVLLRVVSVLAKLPPKRLDPKLSIPTVPNRS